MELFREILCHTLANEKAQVSFSGLADTEIIKIAELECYKALQNIKAILEDDSLEDSECFDRTPKIICVFEELASGCGNRHDFG